MMVGSHYLKKATAENAPYQAPPIKGKRKVGNPYTVLGKTYYPISTSDGYRAKGIASWYGKDFHGKLTANGERYNMYDYTAAHPTLPIPTYVRVTNLKNGRSLVVRVNDRGPFLKSRVIDLSYRSAQALGMAEDGTAPVLLEALPIDGSPLKPNTQIAGGVTHQQNLTPQMRESEQRIAASGSLTREDMLIQLPPAIEGEYLSPVELPTLDAPEMMADGEDVKVGESKIYIQTGAFSEQGNALAQKSAMEGHFTNINITPVLINGRTLHRVRIGPIENVEKADDMLSYILGQGFNVAQIVVE